LGSFYKEGESLDSQIARYISLNRFWFVKVRSALGKNQAAYNSLHCEKMSSDGNTCLKLAAEAPTFKPEENGVQDPERPKKAQVAYFSKYDQLRQQLPNATQLASVQDGVLDNVTLDNYKPNLEDFIRFKKINKDPADSAAGTMEVPVTTGADADRYDMPAYKRAQEAWEQGQFKADVIKTIGGRKNFGQLRIQDKYDFKNDAPAPDSQSVQRYLYNEARGQYVDEINSFITKQDAFNSTTSSMSFKGAKQSAHPVGQVKTTLPNNVERGNEEVVAPMNTGGTRTGVVYDTYSPNAFSRTAAPAKPGAQPETSEDYLNPFF
jgi:hypothetical protein